MNQDAILTEGRRRLRLTAPWLTDEQFAAWLNAARHRHRGPVTFELTPEGLAAHYDRANAPAGCVTPAIEVPPVIEQPTAPSSRKPARTKARQPLESRFTRSDAPEVIPSSESGPQGIVGGVR